MGFFDIITIVFEDEPEVGSNAEEATDFTEGCSSCKSNDACAQTVDDAAPPKDLNGYVKLVRGPPLGHAGYGISHLGELSQAKATIGTEKAKVAVKLFSVDNQSDSDIQAVSKILDISHGLAYLHSANVVHGDLKPDNILVHVEGDTVRAVLADFGRSRVEDLDGFTTVLASSLVFTAPELLGHPDDYNASDVPSATKQVPTVTKPSDIYALGLVMLTTLSGKTPFYNRAAQFRPAALGSNQLERADYECSEMNDAMWGLMVDCWAIQPTKRPDIGYVTTGLHAIVNGRGIPAAYDEVP
ncbi:hypothetical protein ONZ45_g14468 [Pleurotus djamor]|nr:hypothetical protein ONZ45_g14468 [Pleurotus djamor]